MTGPRAPSQARTQGALVSEDTGATEDDAWRRVIAGQAPPSVAGRVTSSPPQEPLDGARVGLGDGLIRSEVPLLLLRLLPEVVALHRRSAQHLPRCRQLEPLLRSAVRLLLWHLCSLLRSWSVPTP